MSYSDSYTHCTGMTSTPSTYSASTSCQCMWPAVASACRHLLLHILNSAAPRHLPFIVVCGLVDPVSSSAQRWNTRPPPPSHTLILLYLPSIEWNTHCWQRSLPLMYNADTPWTSHPVCLPNTADLSVSLSAGYSNLQYHESQQLRVTTPRVTRHQ